MKELIIYSNPETVIGGGVIDLHFMIGGDIHD